MMALSGMDAGTVPLANGGLSAPPDVVPAPPTSVVVGDDYLQHWSLLRDTLHRLLRLPPGTDKPFSFETMYSAVYKCVCRQYSERLYADLTAAVEAAFADMADAVGRALATSAGDGNSGSGLNGGREAVLEFNRALCQCDHALGGILPKI